MDNFLGDTLQSILVYMALVLGAFIHHEVWDHFQRGCCFWGRHLEKYNLHSISQWDLNHSEQ